LLPSWGSAFPGGNNPLRDLFLKIGGEVQAAAMIEF